MSRYHHPLAIFVQALDQVINHFNTFYPNVTVSYESYNNTNSDSFLKANPSIDIFMTSNANGYPTENCVDLLEAGVDVSAATETVIEGNKWKGTLYSLPMSLTLKGLVVNKTLLAEEGLEVPQTWPEFLAVLESLKQKGYTPIQGPDSAVSTLVYNMGMTMLNDDPELYKAVEAGDKTGAAATKTELALSSNGSVPTYYGTYLIQAAEELISGEQPDSEGALDYFLTKCLASSEENG